MPVPVESQSERERERERERDRERERERQRETERERQTDRQTDRAREHEYTDYIKPFYYTTCSDLMRRTTAAWRNGNMAGQASVLGNGNAGLEV